MAACFLTQLGGSSSLSEDHMKDMRQKTPSVSSFDYANHTTWLANVVMLCECDCGRSHHDDDDDESMMMVMMVRDHVERPPGRICHYLPPPAFPLDLPCCKRRSSHSIIEYLTSYTTHILLVNGHIQLPFPLEVWLSHLHFFFFFLIRIYIPQYLTLRQTRSCNYLTNSVHIQSWLCPSKHRPAMTL
jgi:hypothetical protein